MRANTVEIFFKDAERASGIVLSESNERIPWTAIKGICNAWYIVLHDKVDLNDTELECSLLDAIESQLQLQKAA